MFEILNSALLQLHPGAREGRAVKYLVNQILLRPLDCLVEIFSRPPLKNVSKMWKKIRPFIHDSIRYFANSREFSFFFRFFI